MKLLQVVWNFPETVMHPFDMYYFYWPVREAVQRGWEAEVLTFQVNDKQPAEEMIDGIHVRRCPSGKRKGHPLLWSFLRALLTTNADIIHCHGYGEGRSELTILLARLRGIPVIFSPHFHAYPYRRPLREFYDHVVGRCFFNLCSRVIVFTEHSHQLLKALGVHEQLLRIVPHVARPDIFVEERSGHNQKTEDILQVADITGNPLLLGVGQLIERKGWEYTVRCLPAILKHFPNAQLLIIGPSQPAEPAFRQRLLQTANELGVFEAIRIVQDNAPDFIRAAYRGATLLTHPSFVESFGLAMLEAMTAGLPVVAHNGTGIPCIVKHNSTGYTLNVRNIAHYTQALLNILSNPELHRQMSEAAQQQVLHYYNQAEIAERLFHIYNEVAGHPAPAQTLQRSPSSAPTR